MPSCRAARSLLPLGVMATLLLGTLPLTLRGAEPDRKKPLPPPYYAIQKARIVPVSGPVIENGTVVISKGLITAVGAEVDVPPEAWVIDGEGLTVYPGLIDSLTDLALSAAEEDRGDGGGPGQGRRPREVSRGPEDRPATRTWKSAADHLTLEDKRVETWRKAGFTSAVTVPGKGILPGQAALINLAADRPRELVVKTPVALRANLDPLPGFWSFPSSLMGVLAYLKQVWIDARQYDQAWSLYEEQPAGRSRPTYDRALEPLRRSLEEGWPVLLPGDWVHEIDRAVELARELGARPLLYGAHQGYKTAEELAEQDIPVLVNLDWPEQPKDADPEADVPLRVLRFRARAPSTPAALEKAGVRFAFYSGGLNSPVEIMKHLREALDNGLSGEAALRALTLNAAEIFGVADRLGSLEPGKIANVMVTDGDLFEKNTKVKLVFVDGKKFEPREPGRPEEPPAVDLTGRWELTLNTPQGPREATAQFEQDEEGNLTGSITSERGTSDIISGWVSGNKFSFTVSITMGPRTAEATYTGTVEDNKMTGTVSMGRFSMDFTGTRPERALGARARFAPPPLAPRAGGPIGDSRGNVEAGLGE